MINYTQLAEDVHEWSQKNFGIQPPALQLVGMAEELGELAGSLFEEHRDGKGLSKQDHVVDAICDSAIYAMDFTGNMGLDLKPHVYPAPLGQHGVYRNSTWHLKMTWEFGKICHIHLKHIQGIRGESIVLQKMAEAVVDYLACCEVFLFTRHIVLEDALIKTWNKVLERDWKKFPINGKDK